MKDTAILITGLLNEYYTFNLLKSYDGMSNKFISTWSNSDSGLLDILIKNDFSIILTDHDPSLSRANCQFITIINGLKYIKEKHVEYKYVIRSRTDIFSENIESFISVTKHLYSNKLTVICGIHTTIIYFLDIIVAGTIDEMISFYKLMDPNDTRCQEIFLIEEYTQKKNLTREDIKSYFNFCLDECVKYNLEFIWFREARYPPTMKLISDYCIEWPFCYT